ncbi:MAG: hypothetical protein ACLPY5_05215 [Candidatus Bathyarchaeia archaeon]
MSNNQPNSRSRVSVFAIITVVVLFGSLGLVLGVSSPASSPVMAVSQEQYMSSTQSQGPWYQGPGSSRNCGSNSCVYPTCGTNGCSFQVCAPNGCSTAAGYTQLCGSSNCSLSQCGPNGCYDTTCQSTGQNTIQCSGYLYESSNGCLELQVPVANSVNNVMTSATQFYTLHNLPSALNPSNPSIGSWVTVTGTLHQGANTSSNGAACPGNYFNLTSSP